MTPPENMPEVFDAADVADMNEVLVPILAAADAADPLPSIMWP